MNWGSKSDDGLSSAKNKQINIHGRRRHWTLDSAHTNAILHEEALHFTTPTFDVRRDFFSRSSKTIQIAISIIAQEIDIHRPILSLSTIVSDAVSPV